eukprot:EC850435.1.p2 GENE.EC850435.1~~EC850435.1.p2  ORF type:complete len:56 (-),score=4.24 EC850435.1:329-496(-)
MLNVKMRQIKVLWCVVVRIAGNTEIARVDVIPSQGISKSVWSAVRVNDLINQIRA